MFVLPSRLRPFGGLPSPSVFQTQSVLVRDELPAPLWEAAYVFSTVVGDSGMVTQFSESFDAACRQLPGLPPEDWAVLAALERRGLLSGSPHRRVFIGLQLRHLSLLERQLVQSVVTQPPTGELEPAVLSLVADLCLT